MASLRVVVLGVCLLNILHDFLVSSCDEACADNPVFTPSSLVVKYGDPASANCSVCQHECLNNLFDLEHAVGKKVKNGTHISWRIDSLTEWKSFPMCYYNNATDYQCCTKLPVILYKPPDRVSVKFPNLTGPYLKGHQYSITCTLEDAAPVGNITVALYNRDRLIDKRKNLNTTKKPLTLDYHFPLILQTEDNGADFWCGAEFELGREGPQPPLVVKSEKRRITVDYEPQLEVSRLPESITLSEGDELQLNCSAIGNPHPVYKWTLPSQSPSPSSSAIFYIKSVTPEHGGKYNCTVSNAYGSTHVEFSVEVKVSHFWLILGGVLAIVIGLVALGAISSFSYYRSTHTGEYDFIQKLCCCSKKTASSVI